MAISKKRNTKATNESSAAYFLKIMMYFILGTLWLRINRGGNEYAIPIGLPLGLLINTHEKFQIDRKIEMAVLVVATFLSFFLPLGLVVAL